MLLLDKFLWRINHHGPITPVASTLIAVHKAYLEHVPYENLDIHRDPPRELTLNLVQIYNKIVLEKRGGWCFEMNLLLAWALREMGFPVTLLAGTVNRSGTPDPQEGNHLCLLVRADDQDWLADAGFGNGLHAPLPLRAGRHHDGEFEFGLRQDASGRWWFDNHAQGGAGFDFMLQSHDITASANVCHWLQSAPASGFVRVMVCHRRHAHGLSSLRGLVLQNVTATRVSEHTIASAAEYEETLRDAFGLQLPDAHALWLRASAMHAAWVKGANS